MERHIIIENLQDQVSKNNILTYDELDEECKRYGLEVYEDILSPMEWNSCDRCDDLWETDRLLWTEGFEWDEDDEVEMAIAQYIEDKWEAGEYWSALCPKCMNEITNKMKGEKNVASV